jgi:hypothetical protein
MAVSSPPLLSYSLFIRDLLYRSLIRENTLLSRRRREDP